MDTIAAERRLERGTEAVVEGSTTSGSCVGSIVAIIGKDGCIEEASEGFTDLFGKSAGTMVGEGIVVSMGKLLDSEAGVFEGFLENRRSIESWRCRLRGGRDDVNGGEWLEVVKAHTGSKVVLTFHRVLAPMEEIRENPMVAISESQEGRQQLLTRVLELESSLRNIHERWPGIIFTQRINMTFREISPVVQQLTGFSPSELDKKPGAFWELIHESDHEEIKKNLAGVRNNPQGVNTIFRIKNRKTGKISYIQEHRIAVNRGGLLVSFHGVWVDITRQMIAEKRLMGSAWKETLAVLTMGLAHDFRNTMAGIASLSDTLIGELDDSDPNMEYLTDISKNSLHANKLVQKILDLHQGKTGEAQYENLNELATDVGELIRKITPKRIKFGTSIDARKLTVWVDPVEFRQVIVNLALNAVDAIEDNGELALATGVITDEELPVHTYGHSLEAPSVFIRVSDSGCGIEEGKISRIFEPFYTSKPMNKGSGLGLYNSKLFVERHGGSISVESRTGKGTSFTLCLPLQNLESLNAEAGESACRGASDETRVDETAWPAKKPSILVAGNPGEHLESAASFLKAQGFSVFEVVHKSEAMDLLEQSNVDFRVLLVIIEDGSDEWLSHLDELQMSNETVNIVLKMQNCDSDELRESELSMATWVISPETSRIEVLDKLSQMLEDNDG